MSIIDGIYLTMDKPMLVRKMTRLSVLVASNARFF